LNEVNFDRSRRSRIFLFWIKLDLIDLKIPILDKINIIILPRVEYFSILDDFNLILLQGAEDPILDEIRSDHSRITKYHGSMRREIFLS
jgi:hypothetical protein